MQYCIDSIRETKATSCEVVSYKTASHVRVIYELASFENSIEIFFQNCNLSNISRHCILSNSTSRNELYHVNMCDVKLYCMKL